MGIALTKESLESVLGRAVEEMHLTIAKSLVMGLDTDSIAQVLGVTKAEIEELQEDGEYKEVRLLVGAQYVQDRVDRDIGWDGIEHGALRRLAMRVDREQDTDTLLRMAAVANRATRRTSPPKDSVLDATQASVRVPLTLTKRYTEKLNGTGKVIERSETQQISVLDGSAVNPTFKEVNELLQPRAQPRTKAVVVENRHQDEDEPFSLDELKKLARSQSDG